MTTSKPMVRIQWCDTRPSPAQRQAWVWLWNRLLGQEKLQPQAGEPGAATVATVSGGHNLVSEQGNGNIQGPLRP